MSPNTTLQPIADGVPQSIWLSALGRLLEGRGRAQSASAGGHGACHCLWGFGATTLWKVEERTQTQLTCASCNKSQPHPGRVEKAGKPTALNKWEEFLKLD